MGKHHRKSNVSPVGGFNIGDLLKNIDINQIVSIISSLVGANNMTTNQLSSMLRNFDLSALAGASDSVNLNESEVKSQLSALADRLDDIEKGQSRNVQDEVLNAVKSLQSSPDGQEVLGNLLKEALNNKDGRDGSKRR
ncbi:hypothetical protein JMF89_05785 [Clostridiaceae bacterium UIB06]|uniref:Uncharacterized protein n=1 Tax=Clostridium thailandense TaxID=2794346 RepID=A0A949TS30_9CLOT|nr:hypothetical protein [Clostridium thailandense]MBV7272306.1 hypothetical protein [Clostridium thailandense]MCH5136732.1 hypothetical protein [Clostridiaceae bacterium UIB06]